MNKPKILVTGGCGYIGSHTATLLIEQGYTPIIVDNLSNARADVINGIEQITGIRPHFYQIDCNDAAAMRLVFEENAPIAGAIHFAASKAVGESVQKPLLYYRNNINSLITLLELMNEYGTKALVFSSSCTVYGQPEQLPVTEGAPIQPALSPYGNTKQINEEIIIDTIHSGSPLKAFLLRYFNPIGAHPSALIGEEPIGIPQNLIPYLTQTAAGIRQELSIFGSDYSTPDGTCIRDYINVMDLAEAHVRAVEKLIKQPETLTNSYEIVNIGTGHGQSVLELIQAFETATGVPVNHKFAPRREGDIEQVWADATKAKKVLGWEAQIPLEDTLRSAWLWQINVGKREQK